MNNTVFNYYFLSTHKQYMIDSYIMRGNYDLI